MVFFYVWFCVSQVDFGEKNPLRLTSPSVIARMDLVIGTSTIAAYCAIESVVQNVLLK